MNDIDKSVCPACHIEVRLTDYFCFNCGKNLRPKPLPTSISSQIILYLKSIVFLPLGIIWGIRYLRQPDRSSKIVGLITIVLTIVIIVIVTRTTVNFIGVLNDQVSSQLQTFPGL